MARDVDYTFRRVGRGEVAELCNELAEEDYYVDELYKEGDYFFVLAKRWLNDGDEEYDQSELDQLWSSLASLRADVRALTRSLDIITEDDLEAPEEEVEEEAEDEA